MLAMRKGATMQVQYSFVTKANFSKFAKMLENMNTIALIYIV